MTRTIGYTIRPYEDADEEALLGLLETSMGGGPTGSRTRDFFRWKHIDNPFGRSHMILATAGAELVGLRAFMRWEFRAGERRLHAVRAVDTATHPDWRGQGIFLRLTLAALDDLAGTTDFVFNTPNDKSLPGYLKMGWHVVGRLPVWVRVARPFALAAHAAGRPARLPAETGREIDADPPAPPEQDDRLTTPRSADYLRWRYAAPGIPYHSLRRGDDVAIYRVRERGRLLEATVAEVLAQEPAGVRRLLRAVRRASGADHIAVHAAPRTTTHRAVRRRGFVRVRGPIFVVRPLADRIEPDPLTLASWSLSIGDVEVF
jgi:GNAT superfamily N-acetyltransferase